MPKNDGGAVIVPNRKQLAWQLLRKRIDYLNTFAGNRSEMQKMTREMDDAWARAGELALEAMRFE